LNGWLSQALSCGYNPDVEVKKLHGWRVSTGEALDIQRRLAGQVVRSGEVMSPRFIAGVDISVSKGWGRSAAAAVVLSYPGLELAEVKIATGDLEFPYVPGLLSFRESPLTLQACGRLTVTPDLVLVDGHGIAHPRRLGLASHLGLFLDVPTIGCAKSRLCGSHQAPEAGPGSYAEVMDNGEVIGTALRTRLGVKPVYVSVGHRIGLESAVHWVLACCRGYRLPEPLRLAHLAAGGELKPGKGHDDAESGLSGKAF